VTLEVRLKPVVGKGYADVYLLNECSLQVGGKRQSGRKRSLIAFQACNEGILVLPSAAASDF